MTGDIQELMRESVLLAEKVGTWDEKFEDYSFVVFPAAKAYEGFLKKVFYERGFISQSDYLGKRFRIGRALNPSLEDKLRQDESVYDKIVSHCGGKEIADLLWTTWKDCRNILFHFYPEERNKIDYVEARQKLNEIFDTLDEAFKMCKMN